MQENAHHEFKFTDYVITKWLLWWAQPTKTTILVTTNSFLVL